MVEKKLAESRARKKDFRLSTRERKHIKEEHLRKNAEEWAKRKKEKEQPTPLLMITPQDIPATDRGELIWRGKDAGIEKRLFFEITQKREDQTPSLFLYGQPFYRIEIWFHPRTKASEFFCRHCEKWQKKMPMILPWTDTLDSEGLYCEECYHKGTKQDHEHIRWGSDAGPWPVRFPVEIWGNQEPLRIASERPSC